MTWLLVESDENPRALRRSTSPGALLATMVIIPVLFIVLGATTGDISATQDPCFDAPDPVPPDVCAVNIQQVEPTVLLFEGCYIGRCEYNETATVEEICTSQFHVCSDHVHVGFERDFGTNETKMEHYAKDYKGTTEGCWVPEAHDKDGFLTQYVCFEEEEADFRPKWLFFSGVITLTIVACIVCGAFVAALCGLCTSD